MVLPAAAFDVVLRWLIAASPSRSSRPKIAGVKGFAGPKAFYRAWWGRYMNGSPGGRRAQTSSPGKGEIGCVCARSVEAQPPSTPSRGYRARTQPNSGYGAGTGHIAVEPGRGCPSPLCASWDSRHRAGRAAPGKVERRDRPHGHGRLGSNLPPSGYGLAVDFEGRTVPPTPTKAVSLSHRRRSAVGRPKDSGSLKDDRENCYSPGTCVRGRSHSSGGSPSCAGERDRAGQNRDNLARSGRRYQSRPVHAGALPRRLRHRVKAGRVVDWSDIEPFVAHVPTARLQIPFRKAARGYTRPSSPTWSRRRPTRRAKR